MWKTAVEQKKRVVLGEIQLTPYYYNGMEQMLDGVRPEVMRCYTHLGDDHVKDPKALNRMLLLDVCYLLTIFFEFSDINEDSERKIVTHDNTLVRDILYLVENQIPLFLLYKVLCYLTGQELSGSFLNAITNNVQQHLQKQLYISKTERTQLPPMSVASDLVHLVHYYLQCPSQGTTAGPWHGATEYQHRAAAQETTGWWRRATYYSNTTWTMLRNLMALEELEEKERPVTAYCYFMSQVACTAEDVELLERAGIIEHFLGSDEQAAKGFAQLCDGVALDIDKLQQSYLSPMRHHLHERCKQSDAQLQGIVPREVTQVIYAALAYHKPPKSP
nr:unnamed protein product [Digitaria exilis]